MNWFIFEKSPTTCVLSDRMDSWLKGFLEVSLVYTRVCFPCVNERDTDIVSDSPSLPLSHTDSLTHSCREKQRNTRRTEAALRWCASRNLTAFQLGIKLMDLWEKSVQDCHVFNLDMRKMENQLFPGS